MPLLFPDSAQSPQAILDQAKNATADKPHYLVFFASVDPDTGKPWCPGQSTACSLQSHSGHLGGGAIGRSKSETEND